MNDVSGMRTLGVPYIVHVGTPKLDAIRTEFHRSEQSRLDEDWFQRELSLTGGETAWAGACRYRVLEMQRTEGVLAGDADFDCQRLAECQLRFVGAPGDHARVAAAEPGVNIATSKV